MSNAVDDPKNEGGKDGEVVPKAPKPSPAPEPAEAPAVNPLAATMTPMQAKEKLDSITKMAGELGVEPKQLLMGTALVYADLVALAEKASADVAAAKKFTDGLVGVLPVAGAEGSPEQGTSMAVGGGLVETMKGSDPNSFFMVFAKNKSLKLGIRPLTFPVPEGKVMWFYLGFRLRVEVCAPDGAILLANEAFAMKGFKEKGAHASMIGGVKLISLPCSPAEAYKMWQDNMVTQKIVESLFKHCEEAKAEMVATPDQVLEYLNLAYDGALPNLPTQVTSEFPVIYGVTVATKK